MSVRNNSFAVLILTTLLLNTCNTTDEYSTQTDATQSFTISDGMMTSDFNRHSKPITLMQRSDSENLTLFNFTEHGTSLFEVSDTFGVEGRSIAALVPHTAYNNQSAILYYKINPQPDGSGFAGVHHKFNNWNLSNYTGVIIEIRTHGRNPNMKLIFYGNCSEILTCQSYESFFETSGERQRIELPFSTFKPYFRGEPKPDSPPLDITQHSRFGIQVYGGVVASRKQFAQDFIEIFSIIAYKEGRIPA
ncbi:hypothetical protein MS3_00007092 [Schistosoma haematobium]|uniref:Uncharacterized protein n=2 Tax=Schistosoma haematobium TaxID=6185 RepID=A0A6A5DLK3_SCHHA|nr:hypothetical protein MS3_00007092 [Schistosoma haematobium]KAH9586033.1 hypothetical protein MS3_00007092 [Schistosoma haematobium]CAH8531301.1 unnamed protein product [Schistosoma haematobium]CAH8534675.1 unnamed protein product [Schistosoma haematobium]